MLLFLFWLNFLLFGQSNKNKFCYWTGCQVVSRCHTRGESEESIASKWQSTQARDPPWLWTPGQTSLEVQKRDFSSHTKRTCVLGEFFLKKEVSHWSMTKTTTKHHINSDNKIDCKLQTFTPWKTKIRKQPYLWFLFCFIFIDFQVPIYKPELFKIITEEQWREMINKGFTDASIQNLDQEKVNEVDTFMERVTLSQNRLQYYRDRGIEPSQPNELRIVLIGKVSEGI